MMQVSAVFPPLRSVDNFNPSGQASAAQIPTKKPVYQHLVIANERVIFLILWWRSYDENTIYFPVYK